MEYLVIRFTWFGSPAADNDFLTILSGVGLLTALRLRIVNLLHLLTTPMRYYHAVPYFNRLGQGFRNQEKGCFDG